MRKWVIVLGVSFVAAIGFWLHVPTRKSPEAAFECLCDEHQGGAKLPARNVVPSHPHAPALPGETTYADHIAPMLNRHCVTCHQPQSIGPFPMRTYEEVAPFAYAISAAISERRMPPFNIDNSGACQTFHDARWLSEDEIALFQRWLGDGLKPGEVVGTLTAPMPSRLTEPSVTVDIGTDYLPTGSETDNFRCFPVEIPLAQDAFVTAYEVVPGNSRIVHHVNIYAGDSSDRVLVPAGAPGGYACEDVGHEMQRWIGGWAPGVSMVRWPDGIGVFLHKGQRIVLEIHYQVREDSGPDRTTVHFETTTGPLRAAKFTTVSAIAPELPPQRESFALVTSVTLAELPSEFDLYGIVPHMHLYGRKMRLEAPRHAETCLGNVDRWNFFQHSLFFYEKPIRFAQADMREFQLTCTYDTRATDQPISFGMKTQNEMCQMLLIYADGTN
jgi:hypothetical protein